MLFLTNPEEWSPHATYQATRLFVSNLNARMAQRFMNLVLLPHMRKDIRENRRLHFALFQALKKAAYKPDAFYKVGAAHTLCSWPTYHEFCATQSRQRQCIAVHMIGTSECH